MQQCLRRTHQAQRRLRRTVPHFDTERLSQAARRRHAEIQRPDKRKQFQDVIGGEPAQVEPPGGRGCVTQDRPGAFSDPLGDGLEGKFFDLACRIEPRGSGQAGGDGRGFGQEYPARRRHIGPILTVRHGVVSVDAPRNAT